MTRPAAPDPPDARDGGEPVSKPSPGIDPSEMPLVLTAKQAAAMLQVSVNHLYSLIAQGAVPHVRLGKLIRIPRWSLIHYIAAMSDAPLDGDASVAFPLPKSVDVHQPGREGA